MLWNVQELNVLVLCVIGILLSLVISVIPVFRISKIGDAYNCGRFHGHNKITKN